MKQIVFVTGNARKVWQAQDILRAFAISVEQVQADVPEIQSRDPLEIVVAKAKAAFEAVRSPLVVCDHYWNFPGLRGFPGGYAKDVNYWLDVADWLALLQDKTDRSALLTESVVYVDAEGFNAFQKDFRGSIIHEPRGIGNVPVERITVFDGQTKTVAEHIDAQEHSRATNHSAWHEFGEWFNAR